VETGWRNNPLLARRAILGHLARCGEGWYSLDAFVAAIHETDPDFQRPDGDYHSWYIQDETTSRYLRGFEDWGRVEGALIAHLIGGPLCWLGVTEARPAKGKNAEGTIFRLTPAGAWLLGVGSEPQEPEPARLQVHDDFTVTVPPRVRLLDRFRVARFASPITEDAPGDGWRYRLSRDSLLRAQRQGLSLDRVLSFLQEATGQRIPAPVARALRSAATALTVEAEAPAPSSPPPGPAVPARRLRLQQLTVLQADPLLVEELRNRPELARLLSREIAPGMVVVEERNLDALRATLHHLGYAVAADAQRGG
jgi:hypothetical protein